MTHIHFEHGLGDSANFARMIPLYTRRGHQIRLSTSADKAWLFAAVGAEVVAERGEHHPWSYSDAGTIWEPGHDWAGNKVGGNLSRYPLPDIGEPDALWAELCAPLSIEPAIAGAASLKIAAALTDLPRPIVLLHSMGNTGHHGKSIPHADHFPLFKAILDRTAGTLVLLDWDNRVPHFPHYRLRRWLDLVEHPSLEELTALIAQSDLLIGVDSGPFHLAGLTETPRVGLFRDGFYPSTYCVPSPRMLCLTGGNRREWNRHKRIPFSILETDWSAASIADLALSSLYPRLPPSDPPPRFHPQLEQFLSWCRGSSPGTLGEYCDRHRSFRILLEEARRGIWIETGTIRAPEDWSGAGFSTYLFGAWLMQQAQGKLFSIDLDASNCAFARRETAIFGPRVEVVCSHGDAFLRSAPGPVDLLYLDSCDTTVPEHADVCLAELRAALPRLAPDALVAFDDSPFSRGEWLGKGAKAIPFLLQAGWQVRYAGYQVILRAPHCSTVATIRLCESSLSSRAA